MSAKVLVAYATKYGSTQEVAENIIQTLRSEGVTADLLPAHEVRSIEGYQAVVLGAPLYMFRWHKHAHQFLSRQHKALEGLPVAIFALGPWHNKEDELQSARDQLGKELGKYAWLKPVDVCVFVGKFDPAKLGFPYHLIPALKKMPASDERDWDAVERWAGGLAQKWTAPVHG